MDKLEHCGYNVEESQQLYAERDSKLSYRGMHARFMTLVLDGS